MTSAPEIVQVAIVSGYLWLHVGSAMESREVVAANPNGLVIAQPDGQRKTLAWSTLSVAAGEVHCR